MRSDSPWTQAPCIMFVDSDPEERRAARAALEQEGFQVLTARNSVEALVLAADYPFPIDLLFTEAGMRVYQNGLELAHCFSVLRPETRVILTSGPEDAGVGNADPDRAGWDRLAKPIGKARLIRAAMRALAHTDADGPRSAAA